MAESSPSSSSGAAPEWILTNGLGGYALGTLDGRLGRRYHGLLIAALPEPLGRVVMLAGLSERLVLADSSVHRLSDPRGAGPTLPPTSFALERGLPVWRYELSRAVLERRLAMQHRRNTTLVRYRLLEGEVPVDLEIRPGLAFRHHEEPVRPLQGAYTVSEAGLPAGGLALTIRGPESFPPLHLLLPAGGAAFQSEGEPWEDLEYSVEAARGYESTGSLWSPGIVTARLSPGQSFDLLASTEGPDIPSTLSRGDFLSEERERRAALLRRAGPAATEGAGAQLVLAADQFVILPPAHRAARDQSAGLEPRTVIAGYPWFTDWGRDTMIALEGLTLATGREAEAAYLLTAFAGHLRDGLIPDFFPEGEEEGVYHTADATLWLLHAVERHRIATGDDSLVRALLPRLRTVVEHHLAGTRFGIRVDPNDGLLTQGTPDHPLTWMDAQVAGWIVTPRRGKAVEINALWYQALRLLAEWLRLAGEDSSAYSEAAERARESFNARFWYEKGGYLFDIVDGENGNDASLRPNQVFALSLPRPVLAEERWPAVLSVIERELLTPVGLRSLAPSDPAYEARYDGNLRSRDAAYHHGTVWPWLLGAFVDAWIRVHPGRRREARGFLDGLVRQLREAGLGTLSEICDGDPPYTPRGCPAQAWSVAEILRAWVKTA